MLPAHSVASRCGDLLSFEMARDVLANGNAFSTRGSVMRGQHQLDARDLDAIFASPCARYLATDSARSTILPRMFLNE
jgi:hypothetical protein